MGRILGISIVMAMVFGGYFAAGGKIDIILTALPYELMIIGGAAIGAFIVANDAHTVKGAIRELGRAVKGPKWIGSDYNDLLCLLYALLRISRRDPVAIEAHIERPSESAVFQAYPRIAADDAAVGLVCDTIRMMTMNYDDPHQLEVLLEKRLDVSRARSLHVSHAMKAMADGLPALGIVAAVLGVIKTMGSIDQPPEILGKMIGGALVGTFLGVFLSYCIVGPFAQRIADLIEADHRFYEVIRDAMVASMQQHSPQICVEVARQNLPTGLRPPFEALEAAIRELQEVA